MSLVTAVFVAQKDTSVHFFVNKIKSILFSCLRVCETKLARMACDVFPDRKLFQKWNKSRDLLA